LLWKKINLSLVLEWRKIDRYLEKGRKCVLFGLEENPCVKDVVVVGDGSRI
jgi:hypothetical protein